MEPVASHRYMIYFDKVTKTYFAGAQPAVADITLGIEPGEFVSIVGHSGAGKTTLVNLLPRFFDVSEGAILIDGVDIRSVLLASLRSQVALVTQETVLFDDTIAANIAYGAPGASPVRTNRQ